MTTPVPVEEMLVSWRKAPLTKACCRTAVKLALVGVSRSSRDSTPRARRGFSGLRSARRRTPGEDLGPRPRVLARERSQDRVGILVAARGGRDGWCSVANLGG